MNNNEAGESMKKGTKKQSWNEMRDNMDRNEEGDSMGKMLKKFRE